MNWNSPLTTSELLMLRLAAPGWNSSLERQLRALEPGGILLAGPLPPSPETLHELLGSISRCLPAPPILALEAEGGGAADTLNALLPPLPFPRALAQKHERFSRQAGELMGEALKLLGFDTHFALSLDLASEITEEILGGTICVEDAQAVAQAAASYFKGLSRHKILPCAKHFPGLGGAPTLTASGELPVSGRSMAQLWSWDLIPYRGLGESLTFVLMSTASYKAYDFDYPHSAVLSERVVEGLLRGRLNYRGLVVAPQLESAAVRGVLDEGTAAVQSLIAGCDMLLVEKDESWQAMRRGIEEALASGKLWRDRLGESVGRIRSARLEWASKKEPFSRTSWDRLGRRYEEFSAGA